MAAIRAILFNYGHTLVDFRRTEEALHSAYAQIRARIEAAAYMEVPEMLDLVERVAGAVDAMVAGSYEQRRMEELDLTAVFAEALAAIGFELPADVLAHIVALDHSAYSNSLEVRGEVLEVLKRLRQQGYRTGLVSNVALLPHLMRQDLQRLGIAHNLDSAVFSSSVGYRKPDPRIFRAALAEVGAAPDETVFVGDRMLDDVAGAQAVGMRAVLTRQFRREHDPNVRPDAVIEDLRQLPSLLDQWAGKQP